MPIIETSRCETFAGGIVSATGRTGKSYQQQEADAGPKATRTGRYGRP
jgi:hypothetical protein